MTILRSAIADKHTEAENSRFAKLLFSGSISKEVYASYLFNLAVIYKTLEDGLKDNGLLAGIESICRFDKIQADIEELQVSEMYLSGVAIDYKNYLQHLSRNVPSVLIAHLYVRHFGDMYGGSMIKSKVPGSGTMYDFDNKKELIEKVSEKLNDGLSIEANIAMQRSIDLFEDLANEFNIQ